MLEDELEGHCCFTGHRPEKLQHTESAVCLALESEIMCAIHLGFDTFISGMAQGVDYGK